MIRIHCLPSHSVRLGKFSHTETVLREPPVSKYANPPCKGRFLGWPLVSVAKQPEVQTLETKLVLSAPWGMTMDTLELTITPPRGIIEIK
jgi:hypothetical protein